MKTPMQELIKSLKWRLSSTKEVQATAYPTVKSILESQIEELEICIELAESKLEKEEELFISAYIKGQYDTIFCVKGGVPSKKAKQYYNETFNTKEK